IDRVGVARAGEIDIISSGSGNNGHYNSSLCGTAPSGMVMESVISTSGAGVDAIRALTWRPGSLPLHPSSAVQPQKDPQSLNYF
ncbi:MAG: hypothetical protein ACREXY_25340, partial [Gammaproteobacteria bacterium]